MSDVAAPPTSPPPPLPPADQDPLAVLASWRAEAHRAGLLEPDAMVVATATPGGTPSARVVLCRGVVGRGVWFYTNYQSRKGRELERNPRAAAVFYWAQLGRQVRVEGRVSKLPAAESDAYFAGRPRGSQLASAASPQSRPVANTDEVRARAAELARTYEGRAVPRPPHWGGYVLLANSVELWIAGADRLHDRRLYRWRGGRWIVVNLAP